MKKIIIVVLSLLLCSTFAIADESKRLKRKILKVPDEFKTIQEAVLNTDNTANYVIVVKQGIYNEHIHIEGKNLKIFAPKGKVFIVDKGIVIESIASNVVLEGVNVLNESNDVSIDAQLGSFSIKNSYVKSSGDCINGNGNTFFNVENCVIEGNANNPASTGIIVANQNPVNDNNSGAIVSGATIIENTFLNVAINIRVNGSLFQPFTKGNQPEVGIIDNITQGWNVFPPQGIVSNVTFKYPPDWILSHGADFIRVGNQNNDTNFSMSGMNWVLLSLNFFEGNPSCNVQYLGPMVIAGLNAGHYRFFENSDTVVLRRCHSELQLERHWPENIEIKGLTPAPKILELILSTLKVVEDVDLPPIPVNGKG